MQGKVTNASKKLIYIYAHSVIYYVNVKKIQFHKLNIDLNNGMSIQSLKYNFIN